MFTTWYYRHTFPEPFLLLQDKVNAAKVSGNLDAPEGGFDAIMQAVACEVMQGIKINQLHVINKKIKQRKLRTLMKI